MAKKQDFFTILDGRVKMTDDGGYKPTSDAIWLAENAKTKNNEHILDAGIGSGAVSLIMLEKNPSLKITGIDISEDMIKDAEENGKLNNQSIELIQKDLFKWKTNRLFDCIVSNPPYFSGTPRVDNAHHNVDVYEWVSVCVKRLKARGHIYIIVAPSVLDKVVAALYNGKCGDIKIIPFATSNGIERTVISARLNVKTPANILFPIDLNKIK